MFSWIERLVRQVVQRKQPTEWPVNKIFARPENEMVMKYHPPSPKSWSSLRPRKDPANWKLTLAIYQMQRADSLEKTLMLGKIEGKRIRG